MEMRSYSSALGRMKMLAGDPALDYANTFHWRDGREVDFLPDYGDLIGWSVPAGLLREVERTHLAAAAAADPDAARSSHQQAIDLRTKWREHLQSAIGEPQKDFSPQLADTLAALLAENRLVLAAGDLVASVGGKALLLPVVRTALAIASLQLIPASREIGRCEGDPCGGFFLNTSRSKPRRWCSMDTCGNRAKVRKFRSRFVAEAAEP